MNLSNAGDPGSLKESRLPRRDWILLPFLCLLTISLIVGSTALIAWWMFNKSKAQDLDCLVLNDLSTGVRGIPGCVLWEKVGENQPVRYGFNRGGYRADREFVPKSDGTYLIVVIGSSVAMGGRVRLEDTFVTLLPAELSRKVGHKVDVYNEAIDAGGGLPKAVALRFNKVLVAKPDLVLWVLDPWDIQHASMLVPEAPGPQVPVLHGKTIGTVKEAFSWNSIRETLQDLGGAGSFAIDFLHEAQRIRERTKLALQHFLYQSQSLYVASYLRGGDNAEYLRSGVTATWNGYLEQTEASVTEIAGQAQKAGVPFAVVFVPERAQAAMISMGEWPAGFDPYRLDEELRAIITRHGGTYIDILPDYRNIPNPEKGYLPVDGHPNANGHATISKLLARELTGGAVPALKDLSQQRTALEQGR
jgi:hypothetical protein